MSKEEGICCSWWGSGDFWSHDDVMEWTERSKQDETGFYVSDEEEDNGALKCTCP